MPTKTNVQDPALKVALAALKRNPRAKYTAVAAHAMTRHKVRLHPLVWGRAIAMLGLQKKTPGRDTFSTNAVKLGTTSNGKTDSVHDLLRKFVTKDAAFRRSVQAAANMLNAALAALET